MKNQIYIKKIIKKEVPEDYIKKVISISYNHFKKYRYKKMSLEELDKLCDRITV